MAGAEKTRGNLAQAIPNPVNTTPESTQNNEVVEPIPPSPNPKQYRAIGLLQGKYIPGEEIERGTLVTTDGTQIDAVVLGKLLGLVKSSRIDLEKQHLWVVYPRTRDKEQRGDESDSPQDATQESTSNSTEEPETPPDLPTEAGDDELTGDDEPELEESEEESEDAPDVAEFTGRKYLHVQMAGIWEPETLHPDSPPPALQQKPDYFSIQGQVVYQNSEDGWVIVKVIQFSRKKPDEKLAPYFNLKLLGFLPDRPVKNFWHLHCEREGTDLVIQDGKRIAYLGKKKPKKGPPKKKRRGGGATKQPPPSSTASPKEPPKLKKKQQSGN